MEFERYTDEEFLSAFLNTMNSHKNNTYKFALARFLLEYSCEHTDPSVRFSEIAKYFLKCYWVQECKFKLRQGPVNQTPEIISIIRSEFDKSYYPQTFDKIRKNEPDKVRRCINKITTRCFDDVIPRFQPAQSGRHSEELKIFYNYLAQEYRDSSNNKRIDPGGGIRLNPDAMKFLKENSILLDMVVILEWLRFLERINVGTPRLTSKIDGRSIGMRNQSRFKRYLQPLTKECFYCQRFLRSEETHVEHVIPFDYIGETEMWNLVLACKKCNCSKLGNLPPQTYIKKLIKRNIEDRHRITPLDRSLRLLNKDFAHDIERYYDNAKQHGYLVLKNFPEGRCTRRVQTT